MKGSANGNTGWIPNWQIIQMNTAGRLGKRIPKEAFTFTGDTENPISSAAILRMGAQPLVIWREKVCRVRTNKARTYSEIEWRELGVYHVPSRPDDLYFVMNGSAYAVDTGEGTFHLITQAHQAVKP